MLTLANIIITQSASAKNTPVADPLTSFPPNQPRSFERRLEAGARVRYSGVNSQLPAGRRGVSFFFYVALVDERFPARFNVPGVLSCFYTVRAASRAHPVNSHVECVRTIKKKKERTTKNM